MSPEKELLRTTVPGGTRFDKEQHRAFGVDTNARAAV